VAGELLLDTGPLVALLDRSQNRHHACVDFYREWEGPVVTTEAVLTEASHLLSGVPGGIAACIDFVLRGVILAPTTQASLQRCRKLILKYADLPMDFADSTLVILAEDLNTDLIFTLDRDFALYRIRARKPFRIAPSSSA
jgi:uncharacterized protein